MSIMIKGRQEHKPQGCASCIHYDRYEGKRVCMALNTELKKDLDGANQTLNNCPIVELTECRDCTRFKPIAEGYGECSRQGATLTVKADDFCSAAERRVNHETNI